MKSIMIIFSFTLAFNSYSKDQQLRSSQRVIEILKGATMYFFGSEDCSGCVEAEKNLKATHQEKMARITYQGKEYLIPIEKIDVWAEGADITTAKKKGYFDVVIPQFSIVVDDDVKGAGYLKNVYSNDSTDEKLKKYKNLLLPQVNENYDDYEKRLIGVYQDKFNTEEEPGLKKFDLSEDILLSIRAIEDRISLEANPLFNPETGLTNVLIMGTAAMPINNPIFTGLGINKVKESLKNVTDIKPTVLYGTGKSGICDTCKVVGSRKVQDGEEEKVKAIVKLDVGADESNSKENIVSFFKSAKESKAQKNLLVLIGHGSPEGFPTWLNPVDDFSPAELKSLTKKSKAENVLISGNCFGGIMAQTVDCAFMAANPMVPASGCWEDADTGKDLPDYVSEFFKALNNNDADYNHDGDISFAEAHAYATMNVSSEDHPYTTIDSMADDYFKKYPEYIERPLKMNVLSSLAENYGNSSERALLTDLLKNASMKEIHLNEAGSGRSEFLSYDFGPINSNYIVDQDGTNYYFTDVVMKDKQALINKGMPEDSEQIILSQNGNKVEVMYVKKNDDRYLELDRVFADTIEVSLKESDLPESYKSPEFVQKLMKKIDQSDSVYDRLKQSLMKDFTGRKYIKIGPFKAEVEQYNNDNLSVKNLIVVDEKLLEEFKQKYKFPNDTKFKSLSYYRGDENMHLTMVFKSRTADVEKPHIYKIEELSFDLPPQNMNRASVDKLKTLAKRILYKFYASSDESQKDDYQKVRKCEDQSIATFLATPSFEIKRALTSKKTEIHSGNNTSRNIFQKSSNGINTSQVIKSARGVVAE